MPRKAKEEIIEISKEVTEKKTPVKKATKTTKKESAKKTTATASKTAKTEKIAKVESKATAKKTANKEAEETIKKTTRRAKSVETEEKEKSETAKKTARKTSTAESKATTKKSTSATKKADSTTKADTTAKTTKTTATTTKPKTSTKSATKKTSTTRKTKKTKADLEKTAADVENNLVLENAENEAKEKVNVVEYYDLPYRYNQTYNQTVVKILAQTPNILFVYWDISDNDRNNFVSQYGEDFFNNTVPVLLVINKTMNYSYEVQINDFANSWYLHVNDANCEYQVELGRRNKENYQNYYSNYYYVTTSNNLDMPNDHILLDNIPHNVLFKNVKTQELVEKPIVNIEFLKEFAKNKEFYKYFKELLNGELEGDGITLNLPSSHTSSSFK